LGACIISGSAIETAQQLLEAGDFTLSNHRTIWTTLLAMHARGEVIDFVSLAEELRRREQLEAVGDPAYLQTLIQSCPSDVNVPSYARTVRDLSLKRQVYAATDTLRDHALNGKQPQDLAGSLEAIAASIRSRLADAREQQFEFSTDEDLNGVFTATEWEWSGYVPRGYLSALVGDQGQGKSAVALSFCQTIITGGHWPNGHASATTPGARLLWIDTEGALALFHERARIYGIPAGHFIFQKDPLAEVRIDDAASWSWVEAAIEKFKPPLVVVDSLSGAHRGKENDNAEMKLICKRLAELAQRHHIAVLLIHHLNKTPAGVPAYPVTLSRIRGATAITQFCGSVMALSTPDQSQPEQRRLDVIKMNLAKTPLPVGYEMTDLGPVWCDAPHAPGQSH